jgi:hypothetical protein
MKLSLSQLYMEVSFAPQSANPDCCALNHDDPRTGVITTFFMIKSSYIEELFKITSRIFRSIALVYGW